MRAGAGKILHSYVGLSRGLWGNMELFLAILGGGIIGVILNAVFYKRTFYSQNIERLLEQFRDQRNQSKSSFDEVITLKLLLFIDKNNSDILKNQSELVTLFNMINHILNKIDNKPKWIVFDFLRNDYLTEFINLLPNELLWLSAIYFKYKDDKGFIFLARKCQVFKEIKHFAQYTPVEIAELYTNEEFLSVNDDIYLPDNYEKWQNWLTEIKKFYHVN